MTQAAITGWGKCVPQNILTNDDLSTFLDTNDEWIRTRTGMVERRVSHVPLSELSYVAGARALACANLSHEDLDMIILGSCSYDSQVPNASSNVQKLLKAKNATSMDLNTACTSGMYAMSVASAMIKSGTIKNALVIGAEVISPFMDWTDRNVAILFGDGAAAFVLEKDSSSESVGIQKEALGCISESRDILAVNGVGLKYANLGWPLGTTQWDFEGREIFKQAITGMQLGCEKILSDMGIDNNDVDIVIPHQANLRIIESLAQRLKVPPEKLFINIHRYGNMSAATAPLAIVEAVEEDRVKPKDLILVPAFGAGLTWSAQLIKYGYDAVGMSYTEEVIANNKYVDFTPLSLFNNIVMMIDAKAAITLAVSPSRPLPNLKCIHSA